MKVRPLTKVEASTLKKCLDYDPSTGLLIWRHGIRGTLAGSVAGVPDDNGYVRVQHKKRHYLAHRLAWLFVHGYWPENLIDHINGDRSDNRINNLREATHPQSRANSTLSRSNKSGTKGLYQNTGCSTWAVKINGVYLGAFKSKEEAINARKQAEEKYHGEFGYERSRRNQ